MTDPSEYPVLQLDQVSKSYDKRQVLNAISFALEHSQFIGLLGPNGAGKSTLFQIAAGLFAPDAGTVELFGTTYGAKRAQILHQLGVVFQARSIDLDMSVNANLKFHGRLFGLNGKTLDRAIDRVTDLLDIKDKRTRPVREMSGGEQRRVEVARALLNAPKLVLMDEATAGLDTQTRRALGVHMRNIAKETGTTVLWATHLVDELDAADRVIILISGQIKNDASPNALMEITGTQSLTDAYVALTNLPVT